MNVIVPVGKAARAEIAAAKKKDGGSDAAGTAPKDRKPLPKRTVFMFTEEHTLRKIVGRMLRDCPKLARHGDREEFLVKLVQIMEELIEENDGVEASS